MLLARMASVLSAAALFATVLVPSTVAANISVEPRLEDPLTGIVTLILLNFGQDLFLVALAVYAALWFTRAKVGAVRSDPGAFIGSVIAAATAVVLTGAVIDFVFLYDRVDGHYLLKDFSIGVLVLPALLIFATIAASLQTVVHTDWKVSLAAAGAIAPLSPLGWWTVSLLSGSYFIMPALILLAWSWSLAVVFLVLLRRLHMRVFSGEIDRAYEGCTP